MVILFTAVILVSSQLFSTKTLSVDDLQSALGGETEVTNLETGNLAARMQ